MRNNLHGSAEVVAPPLLGDDIEIDLAGRIVVNDGRPETRKALIVAEIKVGLASVVRDEHFAMLKRAQSAGIDIDIGIELLDGNLEAFCLQKRSHGRCCNAFAECRNNTAGYEDVLNHCCTLSKSSGVSTPIVSKPVMPMRMVIPFSSARSCSSFSACSSAVGASPANR